PPAARRSTARPCTASERTADPGAPVVARWPALSSGSGSTDPLPQSRANSPTTAEDAERCPVRSSVRMGKGPGEPLPGLRGGHRFEASTGACRKESAPKVLPKPNVLRPGLRTADRPGGASAHILAVARR